MLLLTLLLGTSISRAESNIQELEQDVLASICPIAKMQLRRAMDASALDPVLQSRADAIDERIKGLPQSEQERIEALSMQQLANCITVPSVDSQDRSPKGLGRQMAALMCQKIQREMISKGGQNIDKEESKNFDQSMERIMTKISELQKSDQATLKSSIKTTMLECLQ